MNISFVNPVSTTTLSPNLNLLTLASVLERQNYFPQVIDLNFLARKNTKSIKPEKMITEIEKSSPDLLFISAKELAFTLGVAKKYKKLHPETTIVLEKMEKDRARHVMETESSVDIVMNGEQENTIKDVTNFFKRFKTEKNPYLWRNYLQELRQVRGIHYRESDENNYAIVSTGERDLIRNLDEIPFAAYHLIPKIKEYHKIKYADAHKEFKIQGDSFGTRTTGNNLRYRTPLHLATEIRSLIDSQKIEKAFLTDNLSNVSELWMKEFCSHMRGLGIEWSCDNSTKITNQDITQQMIKSNYKEQKEQIELINEIPEEIIEFFSSKEKIIIPA